MGAEVRGRSVVGNQLIESCTSESGLFTACKTLLNFAFKICVLQEVRISEPAEVVTDPSFVAAGELLLFPGRVCWGR